MKLTNDALGLLIYDDVAVGAAGIEEAYGFEFGAKEMQVVVTAVGTSAVNTFSVDDTFLYFRN